MLPELRLAQLLCARLCHDLGGGIGTVAGMLEMIGAPSDAEALGIARDATAELRGRLRLASAAWAGGAEPADAAGIVALLRAAPAAARVRFDASDLAAGEVLPAALVPLVLTGALLTAEALPRGGTALLSGGAGAGLMFLPVGVGAAWSATLLGLLAGLDLAEGLEAGPRGLMAPLLLMLARAQGWEASLALCPGPGAAPALLLQPRV